MLRDKYLIVKGCAGLGNRLFTLCAAIEYAYITKRKLVVDWSDGQFAADGINSFFEVFKINNFPLLEKNKINYENFKDKSYYPPNWKSRERSNIYEIFDAKRAFDLFYVPPKIIPKGRLRKVFGYWSDKNTKTNKNNNIAAIYSIFRNDTYELSGNYSFKRNEDFIFYMDYIPKINKKYLINHIDLLDDIKNQIFMFSKKYMLNFNGIGVHIRATDKRPNKDLSSLIDLLSKYVDQNKIIFLSTDNKKIENIIKEKFNKVISTKKYIPEISNGGIHMWAKRNNNDYYKIKMFKESVIDMWLLSECKILLYQGNSTFSLVSKFLKNDENCYDWLKNS